MFNRIRNMTTRGWEVIFPPSLNKSEEQVTAVKDDKPHKIVLTAIWKADMASLLIALDELIAKTTKADIEHPKDTGTT